MNRRRFRRLTSCISSRFAATAIIAALATAPEPHRAHAWSACGHHVVALIAYDLLSEADQTALVELLAEHPRFAEDFEPSPKVNDKLRYRVGQTGAWPDVARRTPYDRPTWHYQPAVTLTIGRVSPPKPPGRLPRSATLETQDLYIAQALTLCGRVMADTKQSTADRAIALTWIAHLVGDSHQPCHAGSLYAENVFDGRAGDRGGNSIKLAKGRNLHALWDGLLGGGFSENRVRREVFEISSNAELMHDAREQTEAKGGLSPETWLEESREFSRSTAYTNEVLSPIRAASEGRASSLPELQLSEDYRVTAGEVARVRVAHAGYRLAAIWARCLSTDGS